MADTSFAFEFNFVGGFSDAVYAQYPLQSDALRAALVECCDKLNHVLSVPASKGLKTISMPVTNDGATYKVRLSRP
jgi:hypothetical protein